MHEFKSINGHREPFFLYVKTIIIKTNCCQLFQHHDSLSLYNGTILLQINTTQIFQRCNHTFHTLEKEATCSLKYVRNGKCSKSIAYLLLLFSACDNWTKPFDFTQFSRGSNLLSVSVIFKFKFKFKIVYFKYLIHSCYMCMIRIMTIGSVCIVVLGAHLHTAALMFPAGAMLLKCR